jgi:hypothetical protein
MRRTEHVRQGKMDLINRELELFFMKDGETVREMSDRLIVDSEFWYTKHVHYTLVWISLWN